MALNVIDLFCGCGGLSEGFRLAGFNIIGGVDFNDAAIKTFNKNFKEAKGICCDLLTMGEEEILTTFGIVSINVRKNHLNSQMTMPLFPSLLEWQ